MPCRILAAVMLALVASATFVIGSPAATAVSGNQSGTWDVVGSPYIITTNVQIPVGQTLIIEAGVEVHLAFNAFFQANGTLDVQGTSPNPVTFTSSEASPAPGDWRGILVGPNANLDLDYLWIQYGGGSSYACLATVGTAALITWNGGGASYSADEGIDITATDIVLENLLIEQNTESGIEVDSTNPPILNSIVVNDNGVGSGATASRSRRRPPPTSRPCCLATPASSTSSPQRTSSGVRT